MNCPQCGDVEHQPIPEDEAHCGCGWYMSVSDVECDCECHETEITERESAAVDRWMA